VLQGHAAHRPARKAYTFLRGDVQTGVLTYEALDVRARAIAAMLQGERLEGQRVLLLYAPGVGEDAGLHLALEEGVRLARWTVRGMTLKHFDER
jgi:acyl-CoA synthetase (AMP-forming)/AMP-acid ligase II